VSAAHDELSDGGDLPMPCGSASIAIVRDLDTIDSELRLLAAVRRFVRDEYGVRASARLEDDLLDERGALTAIPLATLGYCSGD